MFDPAGGKDLFLRPDLASGRPPHAVAVKACALAQPGGLGLDGHKRGGKINTKEGAPWMELKDLDLESTEEQEIELCAVDREELICLYLEHVWPDNVVLVEFRKGCTLSSAPHCIEMAVVEVIERLEKERPLSANWLRQILREIIEAEELRSKRKGAD